MPATNETVIVSVPPELLNAIAQVSAGVVTVGDMLQAIVTNGIPVQVQIQLPPDLVPAIYSIRNSLDQIKTVAETPHPEELSIGISGPVYGSDKF